jgi:hypothetical protein
MSRMSISAAAALIGTLLAGTTARAEPLGYAPWLGPQGSIFQQVMPDRGNTEVVDQAGAYRRTFAGKSSAIRRAKHREPS